MINGNSHKLETLKRYLRVAAPSGEVAGLSQSRRIEGQFNTTREANFFSTVTLLAGPGVASHPDELLEVIHAVTGFQYEVLRGSPFPVAARMFPGDREPVVSERIRDPRASKRLAGLLVNAAGTDAADQPQAINSLGRIDAAGLVVIISTTRAVEVAEDVRQKLARMKGRVFWVLPAEGVFLSPVRFEQPALTDVAAQDCSLTEEPLTEEPMNTEHVASRIHGYSERGVVNAVFETIAAHPDANRLLEDLLGRTTSWKGASKLGFAEGWVEKFEIYIEPSLSDFGDPDVLLLVKDRYLRQWRAFFIEAKRKPFLMSSPPTGEEIDESFEGNYGGESRPNYPELASILSGCKFEAGDSEYWKKLWSDLVGHALPERDSYQKNCSSLIHELFLKYRFWKTHLNAGNSQPNWKLLARGIRVYTGKKLDCGQNAECEGSNGKEPRLRKIGRDSVVLRLVHTLCELVPSAHFVSLTTDPTPPNEEIGKDNWPLGKVVTRRLEKMCEWNACGQDKDECKQNAHDWLELSHLLSWFDVRDWANHNHLERVLNALKENEEKFTFWPARKSVVSSDGSNAGYTEDDWHTPLLRFVQELDLNAVWKLTARTRPWRGSITRNGISVLRFRPEEGLTKGYWIQVVSGHDAALEAQGRPTTFRLPADDQWNVLQDTEGHECLRLVVDALRQAAAENDHNSRSKP